MNTILQYKARLVAKGFFPNYLEYIPNDTYSQVAKSVSISIFLAISIQRGNYPYNERRYGISKCGHRRNIWVKIPEGTNLAANDDGIHKLRKFLYELKQAFRNWNDDINQ